MDVEYSFHVISFSQTVLFELITVVNGNKRIQ